MLLETGNIWEISGLKNKFQDLRKYFDGKNYLTNASILMNIFYGKSSFEKFQKNSGENCSKRYLLAAMQRKFRELQKSRSCRKVRFEIFRSESKLICRIFISTVFAVKNLRYMMLWKR